MANVRQFVVRSIAIERVYVLYMSVCLYVCPLEYLNNYMPKLHDFLHMLTAAAAQFSSDDNAIRYVLPVLWITGRLIIPCGDECIRSPPALLCRGSEDEVAVADCVVCYCNCQE